MGTLEDALDKLEKAIARLESARTATGEPASGGPDAQSILQAAEAAQRDNADLMEHNEAVAARLDAVIERLSDVLDAEGAE